MNKNIRNWIWAIVVIIIIVAVIAMLAPRPSSKPQTLKFGFITGLDGPYAAVGENTKRGALLAQEEWNSSHPKTQINMIVENDGFDPKKGLLAYQKLTSIDNVDGLINMTSATIDAIYSDVAKTGMPVALGFEQGIPSEDDNVVQLWPGTVPAEVKLGAYVKEKGFKNVVMFVSHDSAAFLRFADGFKNGYSLPLSEFDINSSSDMKTEVSKALALKPDAIVFITLPKAGALLIKQIETVSKDKHQYVFDADVQTGFKDYETILGDMNRLNGSILYVVPENYRQDFKDKYKLKFNEEAGIGSETGYNAFELLAMTYDKDKTVWVNNMKHASFDGADGKIVFDRTGVRIPELKIGTIENGKLPQ